MKALMHTAKDHSKNITKEIPYIFKPIVKDRGSVYEEEVSQKKMKWLNFLKLLVFEYFR